jgi:hypothetical protein
VRAAFCLSAGLGVGLLLTALTAGSALAARVASVSPQGEQALVRQVVVRFDSAVVAAGEPRRAAPFALRCGSVEPRGDARWNDERTWLFDLREPLPAGQRCTLTLHPGFQPLGGALEGPTQFGFATAGPAVVQAQPWEGSAVEEDQHFLLRTTGAPDAASVQRNAWCEVEGIAERVPARIVGGAERQALLAARRITQGHERLTLLTCARPLPPEARLRLVWGAGIATLPTAGAAAVPTRAPQVFEYRVRPRWLAEFSCERERAAAPCLPLAPLRLRFNAPLAREQALAIRLVPLDAAGGTGERKPLPDDANSHSIDSIRFAAPLPESARFRIVLPADLRDAGGRALSNAASFPLEVATGTMPPLAKFAAAPFGIVEAPTRPGEPALVPITLRHVHTMLPGARGQAQLASKRLDARSDDAEILRWLARLERYHERQITARAAGWPREQWTVTETAPDAAGRPRRVQRPRWIGTREVALLATEEGVTRTPLPSARADAARATEVVGLPLREPGLHLLEVESQLLGSALLESGRPMFVRSGVLVTNLAVHFKRGAGDALVWVTTLDRARPVANARVAVNDCRGAPLWVGSTDAQGLARIDRALPDEPPHYGGDDDDANAADPTSPGAARNARRCLGAHGLMVSARLGGDMAFVFSRWNQGIEPWRFALPWQRPDDRGESSGLVAHTVFDRSLVRAGETVGMKHFIRTVAARGLALADPAKLPTELVITHIGSGRRIVQPLTWPRGPRSTESSWTVPAEPALGEYTVELRSPQRSLPSGRLRVEAFRIPLVDARLAGPRGPAVAVSEVAFTAQLNAMAGGPMPNQPVTLSALLRPRTVQFKGYEDFSFAPPGTSAGAGWDPEEFDDDDETASRRGRGERLVADRLGARTDAQGGASLVVKGLRPAAPGAASAPRDTSTVGTGPQELLAELSFADPSGETQTVQQRVALWPAARVVGLRTQGWALVRGRAQFTALALDLQGRPVAGQTLEVRGRQLRHLVTRKRIVGGFYAYDQQRDDKDLGTLCSGRSDAQGRLACDVALSPQGGGEIELVATLRDEAGNRSEAAVVLWVADDGEGGWFAQGNDDRIDLVPEQRELQPGQSARIQVRMPYRQARLLVTVEREGLLDARVLELGGREPVIEVPIPRMDSGWAPNVVVSVLALRGRLREAPWWSFFSWGWREPREWWQAFRHEGADYRAPTATVDLARPSHKIGAVALAVGRAEHRLEVEVKAERPQYRVREPVATTVRVTQGGRPLAGAEVAFAAIDEGLLALAPNDSWNLLEALHRERPWSVETATAMGEVIGRRHYGRKALPPGGGGGRGGTRELFDTRLLWRATVVLDAKGEARLTVPLNDSLTSFRLVAVADAGADRFGTGSTTVSVSQPLQLLPGLPREARQGDRFEAGFTLRNASPRPLTLTASLAGEATLAEGGAPQAIAVPPQTVSLAPGAAQELRFPVQVPETAQRIVWQARAEEQAASGSGSAAGERLRDALQIEQAIGPAVPTRAWQGGIVALGGTPAGPQAIPFQAPAGALPGRGGVDLAFKARLGADLPGLRRWFERYPYRCLEQRTARAIGLRDAALWRELGEQLPSYLDGDGLASYFPVKAEDGATGSDRLTAHLLAVAHEAGWAWPETAREAMLRGLDAFVQGRLERRFDAPRADRDMRRLAALEALSRHGRAEARWLATIDWSPTAMGAWPSSALLDAWGLLQRLPDTARNPELAARLASVQQVLRARLLLGGPTLRFSTEDSDRWWWLMDGPDSNAARLLLAAVATPGWQEDVPRIVLGHLGRLSGEAWSTTTANTWSVLALEKYSARFEAVAPTGRSSAGFGAAGAAPAASGIDWSASPQGGRLLLPWPREAASMPTPLTLRHEGAGRPWLQWQVLAAVPLTQPLASGYRIGRSVSVVQRRQADAWSRGDVLRVRLEIEAVGDMAWVVVSDPLPSGAAVLGTGLGRDSAIATQGEQRSGAGWPAWEERGPEHFRAYWRWLPRGRHSIEYTLRLNTAGRFNLPPTRVEAMYAPENFAEAPNGALEVRP